MAANNTTGSADRSDDKSYEKLKEKDQLVEDCEAFMDKTLNEAMADIDRHFCRRCLIFCCGLHGTNQPLIFPSDKQPIWSEDEGEKKPCSDHCYLMVNGDTKEGQVDEVPVISNWRTLERDMCLQGIKIFGRNSCLISRNLLSGMKTCMEVATYMHDKVDSEIPSSSSSMSKSGTDEHNQTPKEMPSRKP